MFALLCENCALYYRQDVLGKKNYRTIVARNWIDLIERLTCSLSHKMVTFFDEKVRLKNDKGQVRICVGIKSYSYMSLK